MAGMMTERSAAALSKDQELAQRLLKQEQQNYIVQGEEVEDDNFRAGPQESSREDAGSQEMEQSGDTEGRGVEELCIISWKEGEEEEEVEEGEEAISKNQGEPEVHQANGEEEEFKAHLFSQSGKAASSVVHQNEQTC